MKSGSTKLNFDINQLKEDLNARHPDGRKLSVLEKIILLAKHNIDINQLKEDLNARHPDGRKLSVLEKIILLAKHNPVIAISIIYTISPIDIIPDVLPVAGTIDDVIVMWAPILGLVQQMMDTQVTPIKNLSAFDASEQKVSDQAANTHMQTDSAPVETPISAVWSEDLFEDEETVSEVGEKVPDNAAPELGEQTSPDLESWTEIEEMIKKINSL